VASELRLARQKGLSEEVGDAVGAGVMGAAKWEA
jgi:hypothetical protein